MDFSRFQVDPDISVASRLDDLAKPGTLAPRDLLPGLHIPFVHPALNQTLDMSVNVVMPPGPPRTRVIFRSFVVDAWRLDKGAGAALDPLEMKTRPSS